MFAFALGGPDLLRNVVVNAERSPLNAVQHQGDSVQVQIEDLAVFVWALHCSVKRLSRKDLRGHGTGYFFIAESGVDVATPWDRGEAISGMQDWSTPRGPSDRGS